jgi:hypothetical protein
VAIQDFFSIFNWKVFHIGIFGYVSGTLGTQNNLDFRICFLPNLCYGVYIPVDEVAEIATFHAGSKLRHWPPGTNSMTVRAVFFLRQRKYSVSISLKIKVSYLVLNWNSFLRPYS